ncbi:MAG: hypothetical protein HDS67_02245 [Bacteroidales bacterium]|nr:hypothetical protein [Bacteroidales bacterium]
MTRDNGPTRSETAREKYLTAFYSTMARIWKDRVMLTRAFDTGALYTSIQNGVFSVGPQALSTEMQWSFLRYGVFVDAGTGRNTWRGNGGDLGRDNTRRRKRWFSRKHFSSYMNLKEFYEENIGRDATQIISNALTKDLILEFGSP